MQIVTLDFETYWDSEHSLSKMNAIEYVLHDDTDVISCAFKINDGPTEVVFGDDICHYINDVDWSRTIALGHNMSEFDALILAWRYGVDPLLWACTAAMARPIYAKTCGCSLKALADELGVGRKLSLEATNTKGKRLADFTLEEIDAMREYNKVDVDLCYSIFKKLKPLTPAREMRLIDATVRMTVGPRFEADTNLLKRGLVAERKRREQLLIDVVKSGALRGIAEKADDALEVVASIKTHLASTAKFAKALEALGVDVPMKVSMATGKPIPALAKSDAALQQLREHEDPRVVALVEARLGVKSTLLEKRIQSFIRTANLCNGKMPMPLRYYGADTTGRWSGTMKLNVQNMPRIGKEPKISDVLRKSLRAPKGYMVVAVDLSGIELRINHFLWKVDETISLYKNDPTADLYVEFGKSLYNTDTVSSDQRLISKIAQLGLGFGAAYKTFKEFARAMGGVILSDEESRTIVNSWRERYFKIVQGWQTCHTALDYIHADEHYDIDPWGLCHTTNEGIVTPRGVIRYPNLRRVVNNTTGRVEWRYGRGRNETRIYAGKVDENIVQHLARQVFADCLLGYLREGISQHAPPVLLVHDEIVCIAPESIAQECLDTLNGIMRSPPKWWPGLVTWSEGGIGDTYGDVK